MAIRIGARSKEEIALRAVCSREHRVRAFHQMPGHLRATLRAVLFRSRLHRHPPMEALAVASLKSRHAESGWTMEYVDFRRSLLVRALAGFGRFRRLFQLALILASRSFTHAALFSVPLCALKRDYA